MSNDSPLLQLDGSLCRLHRDSEMLCLDHGEKMALCPPREAWEKVAQGASVSELKRIVGDDPQAKGRFFLIVGYLLRSGLLYETHLWHEKPFLRRWISHGFEPKKPQTFEGPLVLSKYAYLRNSDGLALLESPCSRARILLLQPGLESGLFAAHHAIEDPLTRLLYESGFLVQEGLTERPDQLRWEFHDLLFHVRSRPGRHHSPRRRGPESEVLPMHKEPNREACQPLSPVDLDEVEARDPTLNQVLRARASRRESSHPQFCEAQLSEFLYRTGKDEGGRRPYPSGGGRYELELYLNVRECEGIDPGLYRYSPDSHGLERYPASQRVLQQHLQFAANATGANKVPRVFLIYSAKFQRVSARYRSIVYALVLKHVGVLMQTMYLVAQAMDIPCCAIGTGPCDVEREMLNTEMEVEDAVGEFALW